eukprot:scaffold33091_cov61-Phaeocystis_antarctica.AAC.7
MASPPPPPPVVRAAASPRRRTDRTMTGSSLGSCCRTTRQCCPAGRYSHRLCTAGQRSAGAGDGCRSRRGCSRAMSSGTRPRVAGTAPPRCCRARPRTQPPTSGGRWRRR